MHFINLAKLPAARPQGKLEDPAFKERARKPGPGAYDANDSLVRRSSGGFSIYGRLEAQVRCFAGSRRRPVLITNNIRRDVACWSVAVGHL